MWVLWTCCRAVCFQELVMHSVDTLYMCLHAGALKPYPVALWSCVCLLIVIAFKLYNIYFCNNVCPLFVYFAMCSDFSYFAMWSLRCLLRYFSLRCLVLCFRVTRHLRIPEWETQYVWRGLGGGGEGILKGWYKLYRQLLISIYYRCYARLQWVYNYIGIIRCS